jgi:hypothetical protein
VWFWLRDEFDVEQGERFGLDWVGGGEAREGVLAVGDAEVVAADGPEFGEQVSEVVGGEAVGGAVDCSIEHGRRPRHPKSPRLRDGVGCAESLGSYLISVDDLEFWVRRRAR